MSPKGAPSQSPTLSRDCGTTLGWRANTTATPTGLRLLSRSCRSLLVIWFPDEVERALGRNRVYVFSVSAGVLPVSLNISHAGAAGTKLECSRTWSQLRKQASRVWDTPGHGSYYYPEASTVPLW